MRTQLEEAEQLLKALQAQTWNPDATQSTAEEEGESIAPDFSAYVAPRDEPSNVDGKGVLVLKGARGANARAVRSAEGMLVLKGSEVAASTVPSMPEAQRAARRRLVKDGIIIKDRKSWRFTRDHLFPNASLAASVVMGRAANGRKEWRDESGRTLAEVEGT